MKKYLFIVAVATVLTGCGDKVNTVTVFDAECEQIAVASNGAKNFVVKCPITEKLTDIQARTPDSMFVGPYDVIEPNTVNIFAVAPTDLEHVYVEIVDGDCGENTVGYRVLINNPVFNGKTWHAVGQCVEK